MGVFLMRDYKDKKNATFQRSFYKNNNCCSKKETQNWFVKKVVLSRQRSSGIVHPVHKS